MDRVVISQGPVPPKAPLNMADQCLRTAPQVQFPAQDLSTLLARWLTFGGALLLTAYACHQMILIVSLAQVTALQWLMVALFTITFAWIALTATASLAGLVFGRGRQRSNSDSALGGKTALLMPVYNEDPAHAFSALHSMAAALVERGYGQYFEIFVISDTNDPAVWVKETAAIHHLRQTLAGQMPVWYRRRNSNPGKKAGNVRDFLQRWGARYDYMVVLDADSLLQAETLAALVREMEADSQCGILQTLPRLYGGKTLFSRLQQFAGNVYGPIVARGITAWQGDDGNFWGHNAIIRVRAFAQAAGLPKLPGRAPFGGDILSHDFVEAALVRRAGWSVRMLPCLEGSWEESPPTLMDVAVRDRRWAQGNLQHLKVAGGKGLRWPNRIHMITGVMSYLASPLWLALIVAGIATAVHSASAGHDYFQNEFALFPSWPVFDSERMINLFVLTMAVLLLPKLLGIVRVLITPALRKSSGIARLLGGALVELLFSVLYAPVFMLIHSKHIWDILRGKDSGWNAQQRDCRGVDWKLLGRQHFWHSFIGLSATVGLVYVSPPLLAWMTPILLGLLLAIPMSALSGSHQIAQGLRSMGLLNIPEEVRAPTIMLERDKFEAELRDEVAPLALECLIADESLYRRHFSMVIPPPPPERGKPNLHHASANLKVADAEDPEEATRWLNNKEKLILLTHSDAFQRLVALRQGSARQATPR